MKYGSKRLHVRLGRGAVRIQRHAPLAVQGAAGAYGWLGLRFVMRSCDGVAICQGREKFGAEVGLAFWTLGEESAADGIVIVVEEGLAIPLHFADAIYDDGLAAVNAEGKVSDRKSGEAVAKILGMLEEQ